MAKEWYVIHTFSGHEKKVQIALEKKVEMLGLSDQIFQVKIPTVDVPEVKNGKKTITSKKFFPGYVLVELEMNDETWTTVKSINGVTNFVGAIGTGKPKPLSASEVNSLFDQMGEQKVRDKVSVVMDFSIGEPVKVIDGPFNSFNGIIDEIYPEKARVRVKVEIFGRGTPVELDFDQIGKL